MKRRIRGRKSRSFARRRVVTNWGVWGRQNSAKEVFRDGKEGASDKVMANVPAGYERIAATPKFKRRKVSTVWDFPPGYRRVTASNFELCRQIAVNQSSQGNW
ncbi:hypothetical protein J1N35_021973 [Gossypium stocksii]|uniref:Uncharacterized protein n=1 Tax=Gossypium stocksii TaxID=47602 RepID=A0A9D3VH94_9ROSI|nr:hypothetical protein J1N35_021973 [Gossypium stocksii]